jgi:hypothetical protein
MELKRRWSEGCLRCAPADDVALLCDLGKVDLSKSVGLWSHLCCWSFHLAIVAVANAADEELELIFVGSWSHLDCCFTSRGP